MEAEWEKLVAQPESDLVAESQLTWVFEAPAGSLLDKVAHIEADGPELPQAWHAAWERYGGDFSAKPGWKRPKHAGQTSGAYKPT